MSPVTNTSNGLSYLTQPGGLLSNLPAAISASALQSASPQDLVSLSDAALQLQVVDGLFGVQPGSQDTLPGVSSADLANATPQQSAAISDQALMMQQAQGLFDTPAGSGGTVSVLA